MCPAVETYVPSNIPCEVDLTDPAILHQLHDVTSDGIPRFSQPYCQFLYDLTGYKMERLARRIDQCSIYFRRHNDGGHLWSENISCCKQGSCIKCALYRATVEYDKYQLLSQTLDASFTYIVTHRSLAKRVKKILNRLKRPLLAKVGWIDNRMADRMLWCESIHSITGKMLDALRRVDPFISIRAYDKSMFSVMLKVVLRPEIPPDNADRLAYELIKRRLSFQGMSQGDRAKIFANASIDPNRTTLQNDSSDASTPPDDLSPLPKKRVCRCPECGKPSLWHTQRITLSTPATEFHWYKTTPDSPPPPL